MSPRAATAGTVYRLVYSSVSTVPFSHKELTELLAVARRNNAAIGVTGMLLYHEGSFLQVLEGDQAAVEAVFDKIEQDPRHDATIVLLREEAKRTFGEWTMGFVELDSARLLDLAGSNDFLRTGWSKDDAVRGDRVRSVLDQFRGGRWRRSISG